MNHYPFRKLISTLLLLITAATFQHCANVMAPVGGPRDLTPPRVTESNPPNKSILFKGNKFSLRFDEYIKLEKINQQLLISPPMNEFPDVKLKGKELILKFKENLKPNTTYSVFFGDAIQDITEGNILHNYTYIFSTGNKIDSLSMRGRVVEASDLKPVKDVSVMLYKNNNDTLPLKALPLYVKPYYISKTNEDGYFSFSGLADTSYMLFALEDKNYSLTYDQPSEQIAFADSFVKPQFKPISHIDSSLFDTITQWPHDSLQHFIDSLWQQADSISNNSIQMHQLFMFRQKDSVQKLLKAELIRPNTLRFVFRLPANNINIIPLYFHPDSLWHLDEWGKNKDTLVWYLKKNHPDSLHLVFIQNKNILDTTHIRVIPKKILSKHAQKKQVNQKKYLGWHTNLQGTIKPEQTLLLQFNSPLSKIISDSILFVADKDSLWQPPFHFIDSLKRKIIFPFKVTEGAHYQLLIPDSVIIDWNGFSNKKIHINLNSKQAKEYGSLHFNLNPGKKNNYIFILLNDKDKVLKQVFFTKTTDVKLNYLDPGQYQFKIVFDDNHNNKWDSGDYFKEQEPEKVIYYQKKIKIRPNWEVNEVWDF